MTYSLFDAIHKKIDSLITTTKYKDVLHIFVSLTYTYMYAYCHSYTTAIVLGRRGCMIFTRCVAFGDNEDSSW